MIRNYVRARIAELRYRGLRQRDPWFYSHYVAAANQVGRQLSRYIPLKSARILDFGCGDGFMALGMHRFDPKEVIGVDLNPAYQHLPEVAHRYLGMQNLPEKISFRQVEENKPLPFPDEFFDAAYAWSVFEHVQDVDQTLQELHRVLTPGGIFFIQIEPLYYSPFGSHLRRLIPEPWAHLKLPEEELLQRAIAAEDQIASVEKDLAYQSLEFETYKQFLLNEYRQLNRVTMRELTELAERYFRLVLQQRVRAYPYSAPPELLTRYAEADLLTNEIGLTVQKREKHAAQVPSSMA